MTTNTRSRAAPMEPILVEVATAHMSHSDLASGDDAHRQVRAIQELLQGPNQEPPLVVLPIYQQAERVQQAPDQVELFGT